MDDVPLRDSRTVRSSCYGERVVNALQPGKLLTMNRFPSPVLATTGGPDRAQTDQMTNHLVRNLEPRRL